MGGSRVFRFAGRILFPTLGILGFCAFNIVGSLLLVIVSLLVLKNAEHGTSTMTIFGAGALGWASTLLIGFLLLRGLEARDPNRFRNPALLSVVYGAFSIYFWGAAARNSDTPTLMIIGLLYGLYSCLGIWLYVGTVKYPSLQLFDDLSDDPEMQSAARRYTKKKEKEERNIPKGF